MPNRHGVVDQQLTHRLARLLRVRQAILDEPGISRHELAARFAVSERRMTDDLNLLRAAGVPVQRVTGGYIISEEPT